MIRVLSQKVAELIAAGEVIERPASVVKELVENAMDAGATTIFVALEGGGVRSLVVRDNGSGIPRAEVPTAFLRHATSKIAAADDLNKIETMGFRGEALASIAAVSKVRVTTRTKEEPLGTAYALVGGQNAVSEDAGCPVGTEFRVEQLFFNTPARLKFLKTDVSEGNQIAGYIEKLAVSRPDISFTLQREGKQVLHTAGDGDLKACLWAVYGREFASHLLPVSAELNGMRITGFVTAPEGARSRRALQLFFVNNRLFQSRACQAVLEEAMKGRVVSGLHPGCALFLQLPPGQVDVNVHPAKLEVRFANERDVYRLIHFAVKQALMDAETDPFAGYRKNEKEQKAPPQGLPPVSKPAEAQLRLQNIPVQYPAAPEEKKKEKTDSAAEYVEKLRGSFGVPMTVQEPENGEKENLIVHSAGQSAQFDVPREEPPLPKTETADTAFSAPRAPQTEQADGAAAPVQMTAPDFRYIGCFAKTYLLAELEGALMVVDQHAAHEKILYEQIIRRQQTESQLLIDPIVLELSAGEFDGLLQQTPQLDLLGFFLEPFGPSSLMVRRIPAVLRPEKAEEALLEMAESFATTGTAKESAKALEWIAHSVACRAAVKAGDKLNEADAVHLIETVLNNPAIRHCPHGRPVYFLMDDSELEKRFGRI